MINEIPAYHVRRNDNLNYFLRFKANKSRQRETVPQNLKMLNVFLNKLESSYKRFSRAIWKNTSNPFANIGN
jgi:hypothetical protein